MARRPQTRRRYRPKVASAALAPVVVHPARRLVAIACGSCGVASIGTGILAGVLQYHPLGAVAMSCIGMCAALVGVLGVLDGEHVTRQGTFRRAEKPVRFWLMSAVMVGSGLMFFVAGLLALAGVIEIGTPAPQPPQ